LNRADRLHALIGAEEAALETAPPGEDGEADPENLARQRERLEAAIALLGLARDEMEDARRSLGDAEGADANFDDASLRTERAVKHLASLRRLFFSIVELVRDIAERQLEVADSTQDLAALAKSDTVQEKLGPLVPRQKTLSKRTETIAFELEKQSQESDPNQDPSTAEEAATRLRLAAESLLYAEDSMQDALKSFGAEPPVLEEARTHQESALVELAKALEQLAPPPPPEQPEQGEDEQGEGEDQQQQGESQPEEQGMDPEQLLQGVRDREAQRREERANNTPSGYETVEKDW
jgi:hypothetical protein